MCVCPEIFIYINYIYIIPKIWYPLLHHHHLHHQTGCHPNPTQGKHEECLEMEKVKDSCGTHDLANLKKKKNCVGLLLYQMSQALAENSLIILPFFFCKQLILILVYRIWKKMEKNHSFINYFMSNYKLKACYKR